MTDSKLLYCFVCLTAGWSFLALVANDLLIREVAYSGFVLIIAALTFPLGLLGIATGLAAVFIGLLTPLEFVALATPFCAALGYCQWFHLPPRVFRNKSKTITLEEVFK